MTIPHKKLKNGFALPCLGLGTWRMGGDRKRDPRSDDQKYINAIQNAIKKGITHIDTAEMYAEGHAEELVGTAIKDFDRRKLFITSKVWQSNLHYENVLKSCENSLKRLGTDYLDLYLIHMPNQQIPLEETIKAMDRLKKEKLIKYIGLSDFSKSTFQKAQSFSSNKIVCDQVHYNLIYREPEASGLLEYCQKNDVMLVAWRPVEKGLLSVSPPDVMRQVMEKYGKSASQIALNWLFSQKNVAVICKMTDSSHLEENLGSLGWSLEDRDIEDLRLNFPGQKEVSGAVPLR